ncbi:MAG TPA: HEAT repeat domain-containing protein [Nitrospirota bacterium]|nr:HEAT repeat domain-containing protein [Nitrospirota bacterium]
MHDNLTIIIIVAAIAALLFLIVVLLIASVVRRALNERRYRKLDALREKYREQAHRLLDKDGMAGNEPDFAAATGSLEWQAVEEVLLDLMNSGVSGDKLKVFFQRLGYVAYYENRLANRNRLVRASAIDKLGRMGSQSSLPKLLLRLDETDPEILTVTVRALSRIGDKEGLMAIVERLPVLLGQGQVTRKAMETALLNFGKDAVVCLVEYHIQDSDPWIMSCVLETLSHLPSDFRSLSLASEHLGSTNPEVRSKALKVIGRAEAPLPASLPALILPLLDDPVWFVRLQAIKSVNKLDCAGVAKSIGKLLFDKNWQVRSAAALSLAQLGTCAMDVFLDALVTEDIYAKESICEEIEKSRFVDQLIEHLGGNDETLRTKSAAILRIMHSLQFSTPLLECSLADGSGRIKEEINKILAAGAGR